MPLGQTDRQTDGRTPDRYITLFARRGQRYNPVDTDHVELTPFVDLIGADFMGPKGLEPTPNTSATGLMQWTAPNNRARNLSNLA